MALSQSLYAVIKRLRHHIDDLVAYHMVRDGQRMTF